MLRSASQAKLDQLEESLRMLKQIPRSEARSAEGARLANEIAALEAQVPRLINAKLFEAQAWRIVGGPEALKKSDTALRLARGPDGWDVNLPARPTAMEGTLAWWSRRIRRSCN